MRKASKTSPPSTQLSLEAGWTSSVVASPASHLVLPANEKERMITVTSGRTCVESLAKFSHVTSWQRTFLGLLTGTKAWYSSKCILTWKLQVSRSKRLYCRLQVSGHHTAGTGSGLLPTPTTMDHMAPKTEKALYREITEIRPGRKQLANLRDVVAHQQHPLLPTPTARDWKGPQARAYRGKPDDLGGVIRFKHGIPGHLSPRFVGQMMGFPPDWTVLPFQSGEQKA